MGCAACPAVISRSPARTPSTNPAAVITVNVKNLTEEAAIKAKFPGYRCRRQVFGSQSIQLILTRI